MTKWAIIELLDWAMGVSPLIQSKFADFYEKEVTKGDVVDREYMEVLISRFIGTIPNEIEMN